MSDADTIATIKSQTLARIAEITAQPKPTYQIDGQMIAWGDYLSQLQRTVDWCNEKLAGEATVRGAVARIFVGEMTKHERRMTKENPFGFRASDFFRHSSFVLRHFPISSPQSLIPIPPCSIHPTISGP